MLNKNKSIAVASVVLLAGVMMATTTLAGFADLGAAPSAEPAALADFDLRPGFDTRQPGLDLTTTASVTPGVETTAPIRRSSPNYNVFKSVVVPVGKLKAFAQWGKVRPAASGADVCVGKGCDGKIGRKLEAIAEQARGLSPVEAAKLVNREVNRLIAYRSDRADVWQTLAQSAARGAGDCEDFAIAKMQLLAGIGFAPEQLQFIVLKDTRRQLYHAVLAVHVDGKRLILDNLSNTAASDDIFRTYKPIVSFVGTKSYVHGFKGGETAVAVGAGGYEGIRLGN